MNTHEIEKLGVVIIEFDDEDEFNRYVADFDVVCSRGDISIREDFTNNYITIDYRGDIYGKWRADAYGLVDIFGDLSTDMPMVAFGRRKPFITYYSTLGIGIMIPYIVEVTRDDLMRLRSRVERIKSIIDDMYTKAKNEEEASRLALLGSNFMAMLDILDYAMGQSDILDELEREINEMSKGR